MEKNGARVRDQGRESKFGVSRTSEKGLESEQQAAENTRARAGASENSNETRFEGWRPAGKAMQIFTRNSCLMTISQCPMTGPMVSHLPFVIFPNWIRE